MTPLAMPVEGTVTFGLGEGAGFASLPWLVEQIVAKLGYVPYPGTLNLLMHGENWRLARERMAGATGVAIEPATGFCRAKCFGAELAGGLLATAVVPEVDGYPADKLELLAAVSVRDSLGLHDGDPLRLTLAVV
ncbi:MAG: CTP-dependent riboflavin kinase [Rhodocyclaceae bacterium]|nr:CTP-dependent riboflavin kinase [Rhodocyclaceae bacterium]